VAGDVLVVPDVGALAAGPRRQLGEALQQPAGADDVLLGEFANDAEVASDLRAATPLVNGLEAERLGVETEFGDEALQQLVDLSRVEVRRVRLHADAAG